MALYYVNQEGRIVNEIEDLTGAPPRAYKGLQVRSPSTGQVREGDSAGWYVPPEWGGAIPVRGTGVTYEISNPSTTEATVTIPGGAVMLSAELVDLAGGLTIASGTIANRTASNITQAFLTFNPASDSERDFRLDVGDAGAPTNQGLREVVFIDKGPIIWRFPPHSSLTSIGVGSAIASGSVVGSAKLLLRWILG